MPFIYHTFTEGLTVMPAHGTEVTSGTVVTFTATPTDPTRPPTLFVIKPVSSSGVNHQLDRVLHTVDYTVNEDIYITAWCEETYPLNFYPHVVNLIHRIADASSVENAAPESPSGLIYPAGKWRFSQVGHINTERFTLSELLSAGQTTGSWGYQNIWFRGFSTENRFARYGNIDEGVPKYEWVEKDYGGGQVARWPIVASYSRPWAGTILVHEMRWVYDDPSPSDVGASLHPVLACLRIFVQCWSMDCGNISGSPTTNGFPSTKDTFVAAGTNRIPYGPKIAAYDIFVDIPYRENGYDWVNTPQGPKRLYHLYHVVKSNADITPAHGTVLLEGSSVSIQTTATDVNVLTLFTVDGVDKLAENPFLKTNVQADVYVSAMAIYEAPDATDGTPYSFQCSSDICGTQFWSMAGAPPGLTIDSSTGLISGTVPYDTPAGDYTVTVTLDNDGREVTRQFIIHVNFVTEPVPGLIWEAVAKIEGAVTALCQTASGAVLLGTDTAKIYRTTDLENFTHVDTMIGTVTSIIQMESGTVIAGCYHNPGNPNYLRRSTDDGENWANGAETPWFSPTITDMIESPIGTLRALGMFGPLGRIDHHTSTDDGVTMVSVGYAGLVATQFGRVNIDNTGKLLATCSGSGYAAILRSHDGVNLAFIQETNLADVRVGNIVTLQDGRFLASIQDRVYRGSADGVTWELLQTLPAWGGIATPAAIGCMFAGVIGSANAVILCCKDALDGATVYRSSDGFETYTETTTPIDGDLSFKMIRLANGTMLMGTDGSTTNLWKSEE